MAEAGAPAGKRSSLWSFREWRLRSKMAMILLLISQVPLVAVAGFTIVTARQALLRQARVNMLGVGTEMARQVDAALQSWREDIQVVSQLPEITTYAAAPSEATVRPAIRALRAAATKPSYDSIAVVNREGKITLASVESDVNSDVSFRLYFTEALKGNPYISDPSVSVITGKPSIFVSAPVRDANNQVVAVVRSRLDLYALWGIVERAADQSVSGTVAMLLDNNGIRIAHSASKGNRDAVLNTLLYRSVAPVSPAATQQIVAEKRFGKAAQDRVAVLDLPEVAQAIAAPGAISFVSAADNNPERHQSASVGLQNKPWHLILQAPDPSFTQAAYHLTLVSICALLLFAGITIAVAFVLAKGITTPIEQLTEVAERISLGELNARIRTDRKDEIGELAEALRRMQTSLRNAIERLRSRRVTTETEQR